MSVATGRCITDMTPFTAETPHEKKREGGDNDCSHCPEFSSKLMFTS